MPEPATIDILGALSERRDIHGAIVLTYGADLTFFEEAILRSWLGTCREIVILMDAARYADTVRDLAGGVNRAGVHYLPVPIQLTPPYVFHPKMTLLIGERVGRLLIGSGNLTFNGFGHNRETYSCFDWTPEVPEFQSVFVDTWRFLVQIVQRWVFSKRAHEAVNKIAHIAPWLTHESGENALLGTHMLHSLDRPILDQYCSLLEGETIERLTVAAPFLDEEAHALASLQQRLRPKELCLVLQNDRTSGSITSLNQLQQAGASLRIMTLDTESRYLHAKIYLAETDTRSVLMTGSANCTNAALMRTPPYGNVEAVIVRSKDGRDAFAYLLDELNTTDHGHVLPQVGLRSLPTPVPNQGDARAVLRDLSLGGSVLSVEYQLPAATVDEDVYLRLSTMPTTLQLLPRVDANSVGAWNGKLDAHIVSQFQQPIVADIVQCVTGSAPRVISNALWVTNVDALKQIASHAMRSIGQAARFLTDLTPESDNEWLDLYGVLDALVNLEVRAIQSATGKRHQPGEKHADNGNPQVEGETVVQTCPEPDTLASSDSNAWIIERTLFRETSLSALLDYMRQSLPGTVRQSNGNNQPSPGEPPKLRTPPPPSPNIGGSFVALLKKYRDSLSNPAYFHNKSVFLILGQYTIFQHLAHLLRNRQVIDTSAFIQFSAAVNSACLNPVSGLAPLADPNWSRHLRVIYQDVWQECGVADAALLSLAEVHAILPELRDDESKVAVYAQTLPVLASVISAVGVEHALQANARISRLLEAGTDVDLRLEQVVHQFVESANIGIQMQLDEWRYELGMLLQGDVAEEDGKYWEVARTQYLQAKLDLLERRFAVMFQSPANREDKLERARNCYDYGMLMLRQKHHSQAALSFMEAQTLAVEAGNDELATLCEPLRSWVSSVVSE